MLSSVHAIAKKKKRVGGVGGLERKYTCRHFAGIKGSNLEFCRNKLEIKMGWFFFCCCERWTELPWWYGDHKRHTQQFTF